MSLKREKSTACVVLVTTPSHEEAQMIAGTLVEERLAACVNIIQIESIYRWDGKICTDPEWQLIAKTQFDTFPALEKRVADLHSYDLPEIIAIPITAGSPSYLEWISTEVPSTLPLDNKSKA